MAIFTDAQEQLNIGQIEEIENYVKLSFPQEYKDYLLQSNGGRCEPNVFGFIENEEITNSSIDWFLSIYDGEYDNLKDYIDMYKIEEKRIPTHILPIAHDPGGNLICISCGKKDNGYIYFWDHEKEVDYNKSDDNDYSNLYLVAKSFTKFIDNLEDEN